MVIFRVPVPALIGMPSPWAPVPAAAPALRYYMGALPLLLPMKGLFVE